MDVQSVVLDTISQMSPDSSGLSYFDHWAGHCEILSRLFGLCCQQRFFQRSCLDTAQPRVECGLKTQRVFELRWESGGSGL